MIPMIPNITLKKTTERQTKRKHVVIKYSFESLTTKSTTEKFDALEHLLQTKFPPLLSLSDDEASGSGFLIPSV